jgi:hypothetical protein
VQRHQKDHVVCMSEGRTARRNYRTFRATYNVDCWLQRSRGRLARDYQVTTHGSSRLMLAATDMETVQSTRIPVSLSTAPVAFASRHRRVLAQT